jgi:hypothetical protein
MPPRRTHEVIGKTCGGRFRGWTAVLSVVLLAGARSGDAGADQPVRDRPARRDPASLRDYLPILLQKALLDSEREQVHPLDDLLKLARALEEGGEFSQTQVDAVERALLDARVRVREREAKYQNAMDQFQLHFRAGPQRLHQLEETSVGPLQQHLREFQKVSADFRAALAWLNPAGAPDRAPKLRADLHAHVAAASLVKGTRFGNQLETDWKAWEKRSEDGMAKGLAAYHEERRRLLDKQTDLEINGQALPAADRQRLDEVNFQLDLGNFEPALRDYESQPWKDLAKPQLRQRRQQSLFVAVGSTYVTVLTAVRDERLGQLRARWPTLPTVRVEGTDLVAGDPQKAERTLASRLKTPEALTTGKRDLRAVRTLAEMYRLQQRSFALAYLQVEDTFLELGAPSPPSGSFAIRVSALIRQELQGQRALTRARGQLIRTWVQYLTARLDLYRDLNLPPP